jgi:hypothetical protein
MHGRIIDAHRPLFQAQRLCHLCEENAQPLARRCLRGFMEREVPRRPRAFRSGAGRNA